MSSKPNRFDWMIPAGLIALSLVPAVAGSARLAQLAGAAAAPPEAERFFATPAPVVLHILAAIPYGIVGALQFSPGFRRRWRGWHRAAGRVLIPCALVVALTGLWMTLTYPWPAGDGYLVFVERLVFGSAMLFSIAFGVRSLARREFAAHGHWMMRAYAIGLGAGTQVLTHLPWFIFAETAPGELARGVMMGTGWIINMMVAEWIIRRDVRRPARCLQPAYGARGAILAALEGLDRSHPLERGGVL
jgi:uncharacterized membrane protein